MPVVTLGFAAGLTHLLRGHEAATGDAAETVTAPDLSAGTATIRPAIFTAWPRPEQADTAATATAATARYDSAAAAKVVAENPSMTGKELGLMLGVSERTGRRILADVGMRV